MLDWLLYAVIGKLLIFLWMKFYLPKRIEKIEFIKKLHECNLCSGVYLYVALAFFMKIDVLNSWFGFEHIVIVGEIITGAITSYLVWLISIGFRDAHLNVTVI